MATSLTKPTRVKRINIRATDRQERLIRTGAETTGVSVTDFILESACLQAEHVLADKRFFSVSAKQFQSFMNALDRPARVKPGLAHLFSQHRVRKSGNPR
ncbi:MAG TPA: DUF1778 domain-containing protein [Candidatus Acidoferrales bacterium]|jgi:uncharacterized protein (DUF1778 family)